MNPTPFTASLLPALVLDAATPYAALAQPLIDGVPQALWLVDAASLRVVGVNAAAEALLGMDAATLRGQAVQSLAVSPEDLCFWDEVAAGVADSLDSDTLVRHGDGHLLPLRRRVQRFSCGPWGDGLRFFLVAFDDLREQQRLGVELEERLAELAATLESTADGILVLDLQGRIRNFNRSFARLWALPEALMARRDDDAVLDWMRRSVVDPMGYMRRLAAIDDEPRGKTNDQFTLRSGQVVERVSLPQLRRGQVIGRVYSFRDISERLEASRRIDALSRTDALTGLPNRRMLVERLDAVLGAPIPADGTGLALLLVNLDRFRHINDSMGHALGDRVLAEVAERLGDGLADSDMAARLGADEFVLLLQASGMAAAEAAARRVMAALRRPFQLDGLSFTVTCSLGVALQEPAGDNTEDLLRRADDAMQEARQAGRAGYRFQRLRASRLLAGPAAGRDRRSRMRLDHAMRQALASGGFSLHYQPLVDMHQGTVIGAEALLRWTDSEWGSVPPAEFIPEAEASGFVVEIGEWVLVQAVRQAAAWHAQGAALVVSVNVSALQFQQPGFVDGVARVLAEAGLPPQWLELELTESILIQDLQETQARLHALAALGVQLAIDDFGTGYSSLAYLKRLPIRRLKIDRSFVAGLPGDGSDAGIVQAIVQMGRALNLLVTAEGVETAAQHHFLQQAGCELFQGFLFAPALQPQTFNDRLGRDWVQVPPETLAWRASQGPAGRFTPSRRLN